MSRVCEIKIVTGSDAPFQTSRQSIVLVTGPSGAGRSSAINVLEDLDCETIDNLPLSLVPRLLDGPALPRRLVLGIGAPNRDFSTAALLAVIEALSAEEAVSLDVLYLDCRPDVLLRRYSETRRRHPLAPGESPEVGIAREIDLLAPVRARADILIDTSELTPHDLRDALAQAFAPPGGQPLAVTLHSFSYKRGLPRGLDLAFDVRFLRNPYWERALRDRDGRDAEVVAHIAEDARFAPFFERVLDLVRFLLPAYVEEGKAHLSIGFGCTGGQHRSVALSEKAATALAAEGWAVSIRHHELTRRRRVPVVSKPGDAA